MCRVDALEQKLGKGRSDGESGDFYEWLKKKYPGLEPYLESQDLMGNALSAAMGVLDLTGDMEIAEKASRIAVDDHAKRLLRGDLTPPPKYADDGLEDVPIDHQAVAELARHAGFKPARRR